MAARKPIRLPRLNALRERGEKIGNMPFGSDQASKEPALLSATELMQADAMGVHVRAIKTGQFPDNTLHAW